MSRYLLLIISIIVIGCVYVCYTSVRDSNKLQEGLANQGACDIDIGLAYLADGPSGGYERTGGACTDSAASGAAYVTAPCKNMDGRYSVGDPRRYTGGWALENEGYGTGAKCETLCQSQPECKEKGMTCFSVAPGGGRCYCSFGGYECSIGKQCDKNADCIAYGQQSNGCWHTLKWDSTETGANKKTKSMYPDYFKVTKPPTAAQCKIGGDAGDSSTANSGYLGGYIYKTEAAADAACKAKGWKGLCQKVDVPPKCATGWYAGATTSTVGFHMDKDTPGFGDSGCGGGSTAWKNYWPGAAGAYCCERAPTTPPAPSAPPAKVRGAKCENKITGPSWWDPGRGCIQTCPLDSQSRNANGRCICGKGGSNVSCYAGTNCVNNECVPGAAPPAAPPSTKRQLTTDVPVYISNPAAAAAGLGIYLQADHTHWETLMHSSEKKANFIFRSLDPSKKNQPLKYTDLVIVQYAAVNNGGRTIDQPDGNTSNCGWYGCRVLESPNPKNSSLSPTLDHGGPDPAIFMLMAPPAYVKKDSNHNGPIYNGAPFCLQYAGTKSDHASINWGFTPNCGWFGCRVLADYLKNPPAGLTPVPEFGWDHGGGQDVADGGPTGYPHGPTVFTIEQDAPPGTGTTPPTSSGDDGVPTSSTNKCWFKITGDCKAFPNMNNHDWFLDSKFGGAPEKPDASQANCDARKKSWEQSCGSGATIDEYYGSKTTPPTNDGGGGTGGDGTPTSPQSKCTGLTGAALTACQCVENLPAGKCNWGNWSTGVYQKCQLGQSGWTAAGKVAGSAAVADFCNTYNKHGGAAPFDPNTITSEKACTAAGGTSYAYCSTNDVHYCQGPCTEQQTCASNAGLKNNACAGAQTYNGDTGVKTWKKTTIKGADHSIANGTYTKSGENKYGTIWLKDGCQIERNEHAWYISCPAGSAPIYAAVATDPDYPPNSGWYKQRTGAGPVNVSPQDNGTITNIIGDEVPTKCPLDYDCPDKFHRKSPMPASCPDDGCAPQDCCNPNTYCTSMGTCPPGRQMKPGANTIMCAGAECQDKECCEPIPHEKCTNFPCPQNYSLKSGAAGITCAAVTCADEDCCVPDPKPTCGSDPVLCPYGYENKPDPQKISCETYNCTEADCCVSEPPKPNITDVTKTSQVDNRQWINNSQRTHNIDHDDHQVHNVVQHDPRVFSSATEISNPGKNSVFYPGATFIVINNKDKKGTNPDTYMHYDAWGTPKMPHENRTNNMFSGYGSPSSHFTGPVNDDDPFATMSPSSDSTQFGPTAFNTDLYIKK